MRSDLNAGGVWTRLWFDQAPASRLAALRIFVASHTLWILLSRDFAATSRLPAPFRAAIADTARLRYLIFEGGAALDVAVQWVALAALICALIGVLPRVACFIAGIAIYHLAPLETVIWTPDPVARGLTLAPIALLLMAFSRSGDALTLFRRSVPRLPSWEYGWPVRLVQVLVVQVFFFAGVGKLMQSGFAWAAADNIRRYLLLMNLSPEVGVFTSLGLWIADHPLLCGLIGAGTLAFELSFPLALFFRRLLVVYVPAAFLFQLGIVVTMNVYVGEGWYLLAFVDWPHLVSRIAATRPQAGVASPGTADPLLRTG